MSSTPNPRFSLRDNTKTRILKEMIAGLKLKFPSVPNFIMVIDPTTSKVVSSAIKPVELLEEGILAIERIELGRKPFPQTHAIYFVSPTEQSVNSIIKDFIDPSDPQYGNIHLFFTNRVPDTLFDKLKRQRTLLERVLTFKEVNIDFQSTEPNVFNLNLPETLPVIFSKPDQLEAKNLEDKIISKLATVIPNLIDFNTFHVLYNKNTHNNVAERVAMTLKEKIDKFMDIKKKEGLDDDDDDPVHVKVVVLDRTVDPLTPALYDYYYESMLYEFLEPKGDLIEYDDKDQDGNTSKKVAVLNEGDNVWLKYKNEFISEAMLKISQDFDDFYQKNAKTKLHKADMSPSDLSEMLTLAKDMPMYRELFDKYTLHMSLIERIIKIFNEKDLMETGDLEQCLATSIDAQGKTIPNSRLIAMIAQKIAQGKLDNNTKTRLMIITSFALELHEKERKSLTQTLPIEGKDLLARLSWLGLKGSEGIVRRKSTRALANSAPNNLSNSKQKALPPTLCRHSPLVESILEEIVTNKVDSTKLGSIFIPSADKANYGKLNLNKSGWDRDLSRLPKVIFFMIGGITRGEIRSLQEFERRNPRLNVIVGTTSFLTVKDYISGIQQMTPIKTQEISLDMDDSNEAWRDQVSM